YIDYCDAVADRREAALVFDLDPLAGGAARLTQIREQAAVAASEIEHLRAGRDPAGDGREIGAGGVAHSASPMRERYERTIAWYWGVSSRQASCPGGAS